jgi:hypothetical protein
MGQLPNEGDGSLADWFSRGVFNPVYKSIADLPQATRILPDPSDSNASLDARTRAYLHSNCAFCHQPNGPGRGHMDLRFDVPTKHTGRCDAKPAEGYLYTGNLSLRLIAPQRPDLSILLLRMLRLDLFRMPAIGSVQVDTDAVQLVQQWIAATETCAP